jgi:hypothetical protein
MGWDIQQVCIKCGRQITGALKTYKNGEDFCTKCGGETTSKCSNCGTEIQGNFVHDLEGRGSTPPRNCSKCGKPFPWAAKEKLEESDLIKHKMELATAQANEDSNRKHAEDIRKMIKERISNTAKTVPTKYNNVTNFYGNVTDSQVQQGNSHSSQSMVTNEVDLEAVNKYLEMLINALPKLSLNEEQQSEISAEIGTMKAQLGSSKPKTSVIKGGLKAVFDILKHTAGHVAAELILHYQEYFPNI